MSQIAEILRRDDHFVVVTHINPDGDAVGSLLGMYHALKEMGKHVWALSADSFPHRYGFLPGKDEIVTALPNVQPAPQWIVALDTATRERISGNLDALRERVPIINIDHHGTNPAFGKINLIDPSATSTAEIVSRLLKQAGHRMSRNVGMCLYTGLVTDTGGFRFAGVNSRTLLAAADMLEPGIDSYEVTRSLYEEYPLARLRLERILLDRLEVLLGGRLIVSTLYADDFDRTGAELSDTENLVNRLRELQGAEVGILFTHVSDSLTRVSFRSKGRVDVAAVAGVFGGGGHSQAAGLRSHIPLGELKGRIVAAVQAALASK